MTHQIARWLALFVATSSLGCGARYVMSGTPPQTANTPNAGARISNYVVLVSVDGLRPDAIGRFGAPTLQRLIREGSYTLSAQTIAPSKTLPSHTSMLTGEPPERHGVLWNTLISAKTDAIETPTIFGMARTQGLRTAAFFSKSKFHSLQRAGTLDYSQAPRGWFGRWSSDRTVTDVEAHLSTSRPNVLFIHLADPDRAGHASGWMGDQYGRAVLSADNAIARIMTAADRGYGVGTYSLIITADHGGHNRDHGSDDPQDMTIPWIAWGRGVIPGQLNGRAIHTMDTAATVLWLLGVKEPSDWVGTPVVAAFNTPIVQRASTGDGS